MTTSSRYFEDFAAGQVVETRGVTLTEGQIIDFALRFDPQPYHIDVEAARASPFEGLIASGFHTLTLSFRLVMDTGFLEQNVGSPGMDQTRWLSPVRPGDTIHVRGTVRETRASRSRPDVGIVTIDYETLNQRGEVVLTTTIVDFIRRRDAGA